MPRTLQVQRFAVIMAGGAGTRFWPWSRRARPKQFLPIVGRRTMLQETASRLRSLIPLDRIVVVTGREHAALVRKQLPAVPAGNVLVEPFGRSTAPGLAVAAEWIHRRTPHSSMVMLPADHAVRNTTAFRRALRRAFALAERDGSLVTLGVMPTRAETGYGYIRVGAPLDRGRPAAARVAQFCEKPTTAVARRFIASGRYRWNAGIFVWRTTAIRAALERFAPEIARPVRRWRPRCRIPASLFTRLPSVPLDVAVMEPAARRGSGVSVAVVAADFGWSDVGSWAAMTELCGTDRRGNAIRGDALLIDCANATVIAGDRLVALLGMRDVVVVDSGDAVLICPTGCAQDVRRVVAELRRRGRRHLL